MTITGAYHECVNPTHDARPGLGAPHLVRFTDMHRGAVRVSEYRVPVGRPLLRIETTDDDGSIARGTLCRGMVAELVDAAERFLAGDVAQVYACDRSRTPDRAGRDLVLAGVLRDIEGHDTDYATRYRLVWRAVALATSIGYPAGVALDPKLPDWPVVYIELPTGQVSWHMPAHPAPYDGHDTHTKYARCRRFADDADAVIAERAAPHRTGAADE